LYLILLIKDVRRECNIIRIPKFFHELLGEQQTKASMIIILLFVVLSGTILGFVTFHEWSSLPLIKLLFSWLLFVDIAGGVIANLTRGTDTYYSERPMLRWIFISIHVQPILLAWSFNSSIASATYIWFYTIFTTVVLNICRGLKFQRELAGSFLGISFIIILTFQSTQALFVTILHLFYVVKVIYNFSVQHY